MMNESEYPAHVPDDGSHAYNDRQPPQPADEPHVQPSAATPLPKLDITRGLVVSGVAMGVVLVLMVVKWLLTALFGGAGWFLMLLLMAAGGGYLYVRTNSPHRVRGFEAKLQNSARTAVSQVRPPVSSGPVPHLTAQQTGVASTGSAPAFASAGNTWAPPVFLPGPQTASSPARGAGGLVSALLLIPSLIVYAITFNASGFDSAWQPWWIFTGLNLYLVVCLASRARTPHRRVPAVSAGLVGTAVFGLATSPSPDVNLYRMFSTKHWVDGSLYTQPPEDLLPWLQRAPALTTIVFIIAWGVARRDGRWGLGLIPAGLILWWAIWYSEHKFTGQTEWINTWFLDIGPFIAGCLLCWAAGAMTRPHHPATAPPSQWA